MRFRLVEDNYKENLNESFFTVGNQKFHSQPSRRNTIQITSVHPYDETEYHWAIQTEDGKKWIIYRDRKQVTTVDGSMDEEQVAKELLKLDRAANLKRRGGIW